MTLGRFNNPSASDISSGLVPVPPPIKKSDVAAVRGNYGIAADFKPKGQSDSSLYGHSVKFVLDWWKKQQVADTGTGTAPPGAGGGSGSGKGSGGGKAGGGSGMADTATGSGGPPGNLPHIQTPAEIAAAAAKAKTQAEYAVPHGALPDSGASPRSQPIKTVVQPQTYPNLTSNISGVVSKATASSILTQMGLKGVTPPASVLTSTTALRAWATQTLQKQKAQLAARSRKGAV